MKKKRVRLTALLMAAMMGISLGSMNVYAVEEPDLTVSAEGDVDTIVFERSLGDGLFWTLETDGDLLIGGEDSVYYGSAIEGESPFYEYKDQIKRVLIQGDVGYVGDDWFKGCTNLTSIQFGVSVTQIGKRAFRGCTSLKEIEIPDEVTEIRESTFSGCTSLTKVEFSGVDVLRTVGDYAFSGCTSLTEIELPNTVTRIGSEAFRDCSSLTEINIPESIGDRGIGSRTFAGCTGLEKINRECSADYYTVKDGMLIEYYEDSNEATVAELKVCVAGLTGELSVPENVRIIDSQAFRNSPGLQKVIIPAKVNRIFDAPFYGAEHIELEVDSENTTYASYDGVIYDKDMTTMLFCAGGKNGTVTVPAGVTTIGDHACAYSGLQNIFVPDSLTKIEDDAFRECRKLAAFTFPKSMTTVGMSAFRGCTSLGTIRVLGGYDTWFYREVFMGCTNLKTIIFEADMPRISSDTFTDVTATANYIYDSSWYDVRNTPEDYQFGGTITWKETCSEHEYGDWYVVKPATSTEAGIKERVCINCGHKEQAEIPIVGLLSGTCGENLTWTLNDAGTLTISGSGAMYNYTDFDKGSTESDSSPWSRHGVEDQIQHVVFNGDITYIGSNAFRHCSNLAEINIPASVEQLGDQVFFNCSSLTEFTFPDSVEMCGQYILDACENLETVNMGAHTAVYNICYGSNSTIKTLNISKDITSLDTYQLARFYALENINVAEGNDVFFSKDGVLFGKSSDNIWLHNYPAGRGRVAYTIPDGVYAINYAAFYGNDITKLTIPASVKMIDESAIRSCSYLTDVYYNGTRAEWSAVTVRANNSSLENAKMHFTDDPPEPEKTGWQKEDGYWYFYDEDGNIVKNEWKKDSKGWCWLQEDGRMLTNGWAQDRKGWCWIASNGYMPTTTQWIKYDGGWYHITKGYRDENKWMKDSKGWCWLQDGGRMLTNGWAKDSKGWCWIASNGYMPVATQWVEYDGEWYHITKGYRDQNKWLQKDAKWCYVGADGTMVTSTWKKDSKGWCYLDADGFMVVNGWAKDSKGWCWIGPDGYMEVETKFVQDDTYYIENGYRAVNKTITIDGIDYIFDEDGRWT